MLLVTGVMLLSQGCGARVVMTGEPVSVREGRNGGAQGEMFAVLGVSFLCAGGAAVLIGIRDH